MRNDLLRANMNLYLITVSSATFCAVSRVGLSLFDRNLFQKNKIDFLTGILLNALCPLFFSIVNCLMFHSFDSSIAGFLVNPGVILSGLGAQFAAYSCSNCLRGMNIRNVIISNKTIDLFIPFVVFLVTNKFHFSDYIFVSLTTMAFLPIALTIFKENKLYEKASYIFMGSLLFQALINSYFHMSDYARSWSDFSKLMVGILCWRAMAMAVSVVIRHLKNPTGSSQPLKFTVLISLFGRGALAFLSQASFFFSITREVSYVAWPILNATPILSCFAAHYVLKEKTGRPELQFLCFFVLIFFAYFLIKGDYL